MHDAASAPGIPLLPVLGKLNRDVTVPSRRRVPNEDVILVESGTVAIALTLAAAGIGAGDDVLVPSVNCRSICEAVAAVGARAVLYRTNKDLTVDLDGLRMVEASSVRALITINFFGFPQPLEPLREYCDETGALLIEDCAHAWLALEDCRDSELADAIIGSATKFFPVAEGGFVAIRNRERFAEIKLRRLKLREELKSLANAVEVAFSYGRLPLLRFFAGWLFRLRRQLGRGNPTILENPTDAANTVPAFLYIDPDDFAVPMSKTSRFLYRRYPVRAAAAARRANYEALVERLKRVPSLRTLKPTLPASVIPYMVPLILEAPSEAFPRLKSAGVPMYRWEDVDESDCGVGAVYREALIQLPCHESLTDAELHTICDTVIRVLGATQSS